MDVGLRGGERSAAPANYAGLEPANKRRECDSAPSDRPDKHLRGKFVSLRHVIRHAVSHPVEDAAAPGPAGPAGAVEPLIAPQKLMF